MAAVVVGVVGTRATVIDTVKFDGFDIVCWRDQPLLSPGDTGRIRSIPTQCCARIRMAAEYHSVAGAAVCCEDSHSSGGDERG
jgi:hypothetical protein